MNTQCVCSQTHSYEKTRAKTAWTVWTAVVFVLLAVAASPCSAAGKMKAPPPEIADVIIIGDRVVDIAFNLGVMPRAMSVRGSLWPMAKKLKTVSQILGCPRCIVTKKDTVPKACRKFGIQRLIVEKSDPYCLYMPHVKPENIVPIMAQEKVTIQYVDFSNGLEDAVRQTAKLLNRSQRAAQTVIDQYNKALAAARAKLPAEKSGKTVVIFNGTFQAATGKTLLRVEAPGGYADRFLLSPLGWVNKGDAFNIAGKKPQKGHFPVKKKKDGMVLDPLVKADPDAIIITGDVYAVQKALADYKAGHPELAQVKAVKNMAVFALPAYVDSGVLEYPAVLAKWASALTR